MVLLASVMSLLLFLLSPPIFWQEASHPPACVLASKKLQARQGIQGHPGMCDWERNGKDLMAHSRILIFLPFLLFLHGCSARAPLSWETGAGPCSASSPATNPAGLPLPLPQTRRRRAGGGGTKHHFTKAGLSTRPKCIIFK